MFKDWLETSHMMRCPITKEWQKHRGNDASLVTCILPQRGGEECRSEDRCRFLQAEYDGENELRLTDCMTKLTEFKLFKCSSRSHDLGSGSSQLPCT